MTTILVVLAMAFPLETPKSDDVMDWAFIDAQESWVVENFGVRSVLGVAPASILEFIDAMSANDYRRREWGSRRMKELGMGALPWCYAAQWLPDPEIRLRCRNVIRRLSSCRVCSGMGCYEASWGVVQCGACSGVGHFWPREDFD